MRLPVARPNGRGDGGWSRASWTAAAARLRGPLYAADGAGPAYRGGFGHSGTGRAMTVSASVVHTGPWGDLDVDTSDEPPWGDSDFKDHRLVRDWLNRALRPGPTAFPLTVTADRWERDVPVEGRHVRFVFVGGTTKWCAAGTVDGRQVRAGATGWPPDRLALKRIRPADVIEGPPGPA